MTKINPRLAGIIILIVGVGFNVWGFHIKSKSAASESWPSVNGEIIKSNVHKSLGNSSNRHKRTYKPVVEYKYSVDETEYTNNRIDFSSVTIQYNKEHKAKRVIAPYPPGKKLAVFYDPIDPKDSVLKKGAVAGTSWAFLIGLGLIILGVFVYYFGNREELQ